MGEKSKLIGEFGEDTVENFLKLIGWGEPPKGTEFYCTKQAHERTTHGIDFFFVYNSPLVDAVLKKVSISVKCTDKKYPNSPSSKFKEYFEDLVSAIECFKFDAKHREFISSFKNYTKAEQVGLLFWLSNEEDAEGDIISKIESVNLPVEFNYDSFYVVDNKRIEFIYLSLKFIKSKYPDADINFFYPDTGKNINPTTKKNYGKILPVEYINTSVLPLRIEDKTTQKTTLALTTINGFEVEDLKRLIGLSQELSKSWPSDILICFPDYLESRNFNDVRAAKNSFEDSAFSNNIRVESYNDSFKSLQL